MKKGYKYTWHTERRRLEAEGTGIFVEYDSDFEEWRAGRNIAEGYAYDFITDETPDDAVDAVLAYEQKRREDATK